MYFFIPNIQSKSISGEEASHLFTCRIVEGDNVYFTDGKGRVKQAVIDKVDKKSRKIQFSYKSEITAQRPQNIIFQAQIDKNYLDKLCEIAPLAKIQTIYIFKSERSQAQKIQVDRLNNILVRSCEQSQTAWIPEIKIIDSAELLNLIEKYQPALLDFAEDKDSKPNFQLGTNNSVIVGPEGGFSSLEKKQFENLGLIKVSLGYTVFPSWLAGFVYTTHLKSIPLLVS